MSEELDFTPEVEPAVAAIIFGAGIDKARAYAAALIKDGDELGCLGRAKCLSFGLATS